jgi:hypothetical protein
MGAEVNTRSQIQGVMSGGRIIGSNPREQDGADWSATAFARKQIVEGVDL